MVNNWVLDTPPRLNQHAIYDFPERAWACWATCAEMVIKWKSRSSFFARPTFDPPSLVRDERGMGDRIRYFLYMEQFFESWGFEAQGQVYNGTLSHSRIATLLKEKGPLVCYGSFMSDPDDAVPGIAHAVAVYGCTSQFGGIYYVDPWDSMEKKMPLHTFATKISTNANAIQARKTNYRT